MDTLNIAEFSDYIKQKKPTAIIYDDENNSDYMQNIRRRSYTITQPLHISLTFSNICVLCNPNQVHLSSITGTMLFRYIKYVTVDNDCLLGDIVTLYCETEKEKSAYTLIIR